MIGGVRIRCLVKLELKIVSPAPQTPQSESDFASLMRLLVRVRVRVTARVKRSFRV